MQAYAYSRVTKVFKGTTQLTPLNPHLKPSITEEFIIYCQLISYFEWQNSKLLKWYNVPITHILQFPQQCYWEFRCSGIWRCVHASVQFEGYDAVSMRPCNSKKYGAFTKNSWRVQEGKERDPFVLDPSTLSEGGTAFLGNAANTQPVTQHQSQKPESCSHFILHMTVHQNVALLAYTVLTGCLWAKLQFPKLLNGSLQSTCWCSVARSSGGVQGLGEGEGDRSRSCRERRTAV
jgi:hypothetical protein